MLENETIELRALEPEDLDVLFSIENDKSIWEVSNTLVPYSKALLKKYIEQSHLDIYQAKQLRLVISLKKENIVAGLVDLFDFNPQHLRTGIGIMVLSEYQRGGIATQVIKIVLKYAFEQLGLHQVYANIPKENEKSKHLFKKLGFELSGTMKDWIRSADRYVDVEFYQLTLNSNIS